MGFVHKKSKPKNLAVLHTMTLCLVLLCVGPMVCADTSLASEGNEPVPNPMDANQDRVIMGDELDGAIVRMLPSNGNGKALNVRRNSILPTRQNVVCLYNTGDTSRLLLTRADDDSYYIGFFNGSGHDKPSIRRLGIRYSGNGKKIVVYAARGKERAMSKRWQLIRTSDGLYQVRNKRSGLYWALDKRNKGNGNNLVQKNQAHLDSWQMEVVGSLNPALDMNDLKAYDYYSYQIRDDASVTGCNWMSKLPDGLSIADISIPGSHDAAASKCQKNSRMQCQQHTIAEQLNTGVRYFDIRLEKGDDGLYLTHGGRDCFFNDERLSFAMVRDWIDGFLYSNPGEAVVLQVMVQDKDKSAAEEMVCDQMREWDRVYRGEDWRDPVLPELGELRGKVLFISRLTSLKGIGQRTFKSGNRWFGLDAKNWRQGSRYTSRPTVNGKHYELWTQDRFAIGGPAKMRWIEGSIFGKRGGAQARRDAAQARGKKALVVSYTSCTVPDPHSTARYVRNRLLPKLSTDGGDRRFLGIVCNDFADEEINWQIYRRNF